jgi:hypothetical protein
VEREKGGGGGVGGDFIGGPCLERGLGFEAGARSDGGGSTRAHAGLRPGVGGDSDEQAPFVSGWWSWADTLSGLA